MSSLAYQLEDSLSAHATKHGDSVVGRLCAACAVLCAILGDTLRNLSDEPDTN